MNHSNNIIGNLNPSIGGGSSQGSSDQGFNFVIGQDYDFFTVENPEINQELYIYSLEDIEVYRLLITYFDECRARIISTEVLDVQV